MAMRYTIAFKLALGSTQSPIRWELGARVKNEWSHTSTLAMCLQGVEFGDAQG